MTFLADCCNSQNARYDRKYRQLTEDIKHTLGVSFAVSQQFYIIISRISHEEQLISSQKIKSN